MKLPLHPKTEKQISSLQPQLPHALLLTGNRGAGLIMAAKLIAGSNLAAVIEPIDSKEIINHDVGTISVGTIRRLYEQTRAKHTSSQVFILDSADRMSRGAQAAFLKLLEEPPQNTYFILTSHAPQALLPTVRSRAQTIAVEPVTEEQTDTFIEILGVSDPQKKKQLKYLAGGLPIELQRLTSDEAYFRERAEIMANTRTFLTGSAYEKMLIVHAYHQNKARSLQLIDSALLVTERSLSAKPQPSLVDQLARLLQAREGISANFNPRLQLMAFVVQ